MSDFQANHTCALLCTAMPAHRQAQGKCVRQLLPEIPHSPWEFLSPQFWGSQGGISSPGSSLGCVTILPVPRDRPGLPGEPSQGFPPTPHGIPAASEQEHIPQERSLG